MHSTSQRTRFTKKNRLPDTAAFTRVFRSGDRGVVGSFRWFAQSNDGDISRLGLVVSKRNVRAATRRNRAKRLIRESFRCGQKLFSGFDVIVAVLREIEDEQRARADLTKIWLLIAEKA